MSDNPLLMPPGYQVRISPKPKLGCVWLELVNKHGATVMLHVVGYDFLIRNEDVKPQEEMSNGRATR